MQTLHPGTLPYRSTDLPSSQSFPHPPPDPSATITATTTKYFLHLESLRRRDVSTSIDVLHRYFYRVLFFFPRSHAPLPHQDGATEWNSHQYAALGIDIAHAQLGNVQISSASPDDAVNAAHSSNDRVCNARALEWISNVAPVTARRHLLLRHDSHFTQPAHPRAGGATMHPRLRHRHHSHRCRRCRRG